MSSYSSCNEIHPTVVIVGDVRIGKNNKILPYTVLMGPLEIGDDNIIGPHAVIGTPGQDTRNPRYDSSNKFIQIGSRNIIREFVAIQKPCYQDITKLGNDIFLMQSVHIPHDAIIEDKVVITPMVVLAGITRILAGANLGMGCTVNQYTVIGQYSIVATGSATMKNVKPFSRYIPGKPNSVNEYAIKKFGFEHLRGEIERYVLADEMPKTKELALIVEHFNSLLSEKNNGIY